MPICVASIRASLRWLFQLIPTDMATSKGGTEFKKVADFHVTTPTCSGFTITDRQHQKGGNDYEYPVRQDFDGRSALGFGLKPYEPLPVERTRKKLVALRFRLSRVRHATVQLGVNLQRTPVQETTGAGQFSIETNHPMAGNGDGQGIGGASLRMVLQKR